MQPGKGILAAGYAVKPDGTPGALGRLTFDGQLDTSFGDIQSSYPYGPGRLFYPAIDAAGDLWGQVPNTYFQSSSYSPMAGSHWLGCCPTMTSTRPSAR